MSNTNRMICFLVVLFLQGCTHAPQLNSQYIRPWSQSLSQEYPREKPVIAHYRKNHFELLYLAARHSNSMGDDTFNLVKTLFKDFQFDVLIIESIPFSSGESPSWFLEEAQKGRKENFIQGGESAFAAILADENKIPFFAGEPDHRDIHLGVKQKGYADEDFIGFYTVRQIPQWVREKEDKKNLFQRKIPKFVKHYCQLLSISPCPSLKTVLEWYKIKNGRELSVDISNEETAPLSEGKLFTQKMSATVGEVRDHFTLKIIEQLLQKYKKVAVVYGASHLLTLRKSLDAFFGEPQFIEDRPQNFSLRSVGPDSEHK